MHTTILDTHLHLYPVYDLPRAFNSLLDRSAQFGQQVARAACLAERFDCHYFELISSGEITLPGFDVETPDQYEIKLTRHRDSLSLNLLPGRQVITRENIEILALACPETIADGQPALDIIYQTNQLGGIPVVAWSPGKWFGQRGDLVRRLITELEPQDFMLGDTTLRPYGWMTPRLMKLAQDKGFGVISGSDPLPFSGEENWLGAYYTVVEAEADYSANALLHAMKHNEQNIHWHNTGKRTNIFNLFKRLRNNAASKKQ